MGLVFEGLLVGSSTPGSVPRVGHASNVADLKISDHPLLEPCYRTTCLEAVGRGQPFAAIEGHHDKRDDFESIPSSHSKAERRNLLVLPQRSYATQNVKGNGDGTLCIGHLRTP